MVVLYDVGYFESPGLVNATLGSGCLNRRNFSEVDSEQFGQLAPIFAAKVIQKNSAPSFDCHLINSSLRRHFFLAPSVSRRYDGIVKGFRSIVVPQRWLTIPTSNHIVSSVK